MREIFRGHKEPKAKRSTDYEIGQGYKYPHARAIPTYETENGAGKMLYGYGSEESLTENPVLGPISASLIPRNGLMPVRELAESTGLSEEELKEYPKIFKNLFRIRQSIEGESVLESGPLIDFMQEQKLTTKNEEVIVFPAESTA